MQHKLWEYNYDSNHSIRGLLAVPLKPVGGVVFVPGFEGAGSTEMKFSTLRHPLLQDNYITLQLDFMGTGLSDGDFRTTTIASQASQLNDVIDCFVDEYGLKYIHLVGHSMGACVIATTLPSIVTKVEKIVLLAPALDQKNLLRYRFTKKHIEKQIGESQCSWHGYSRYHDEEAFLAECDRQNKMTKKNYIDPPYANEAKEHDYTPLLADYADRILHIHGTDDNIVPLESVSLDAHKTLIVPGGDHHLERPDMRAVWQPGVLSYLGK